MDALVTLVIYLISLAIGCGIMYFVVKAAVAQGIKDALWNLEVSMRNAVKGGMTEAQQEIEKKQETEQKNG